MSNPFSRIFPKSVTYLQELLEYDNVHTDFSQLGEEILQSVNEAYQENRIFGYLPGGRNISLDSAAYAVFQTKWKNSLGEDILAFYTRDKNDSSGWFGPFFHNRSTCLKNIKMSVIGDIGFSSREEMCNFLDELESVAMEEDWSYQTPGTPATPGRIKNPILRSYLEHYYYKLASHSPSRVLKSESKMIFNTGLVDDFMQDIFIQCDIDKSDPLKHYINPTVIKANERHKYPDFNRKDIKLATFFTDIRQVIFDPQHLDSIEPNWEHIYDDNQKPERRKEKRLPERYLEMSKAEFSNYLNAAIGHSITLIQRNYKLLVPQYWKKTDEIQFLMPLYLDRDEKGRPVCTTALVLQRMGDESKGNVWYKGETVLNLSMAYGNARLIASPDKSWLDPQKILDDGEVMGEYDEASE